MPRRDWPVIKTRTHRAIDFLARRSKSACLGCFAWINKYMWKFSTLNGNDWKRNTDMRQHGTVETGMKTERSLRAAMPVVLPANLTLTILLLTCP